MCKFENAAGGAKLPPPDNSILFFSKIVPTLLYGFPIWGPSSTTIFHEPLTPVTGQNIEVFKAKISKVTSSLVKLKLLGQEKKV